MLTQDTQTKYILDNVLSTGEKKGNTMDKLYILQENNIFKLKQFIKKQAGDYGNLETNYKRLNDINIGNVLKMNKMQLQVDELTNWKKDHICYNNVIIDNINIEDNPLFIEIKSQNKILEENYNNIKIDNEKIQQQLLNIQNKENTKNNFDDEVLLEIQKKEIIKSITKDIELKYSNEIISLNKTIDDFKNNIKNKEDIIENLNIKINNLKNNNKTSPEKEINKKDKNCIDYLYKGFSIYDDSETEWKKIAGTFTYKKFKLLYKFNDSIENDKNINKDTYNEVIEYLNERAVYNGSGKIKKLSPYYKNKLKRVSEIYNIFGDKLINVNIKTGFISSLNKEQYELFINILKKEINKNDQLDLNSFNPNTEDSIIINENIIKCTNEKCNNYYDDYNNYCDICNSNTKTCDNCGDEFITDKKHIKECGQC